MPQIDMGVRKARAKRLIEVSDRLSAEFASAMNGKEAEILIEKIEDKDGKLVAEGYTANYIRTFAVCEGREYVKGSIVKGVITGSENETCLMSITV